MNPDDSPSRAESPADFEKKILKRDGDESNSINSGAPKKKKQKHPPKPSLAQLALSKNFEKLVQPKAEKLKFLRKLRVPVGENLLNEISQDTVYQLDHNHCIKFFCYQAVCRGERDKNAPDNLSQLHRELLDAMVTVSEGVRFFNNEAILNSLRMDERHGLTDNELLDEIEKAKKFIASDDKNEFSDRLRVLKATRTPVTEPSIIQEHEDMACLIF